MPQELIDSFLELLSDWTSYAAGSPEFYVVLISCSLAAVVVGRIMSGLLGTGKGLFRSAFAVLLPLVFGVIAYAAVEVYLLTRFELPEWAPLALPWAGFALAGLAFALLLSRRFWEVGFGRTLFFLFLAAVAGLGAGYGSQVLIDTISTGEESIERRNQRIDEGIDEAE